MPDQDNSFASQAVPEVQNRAPKAPGIMPKNAQTWAVVGISAVMILVIAFSSAGTPSPKPRAVTSERPNVAPPNERQIEQYKAMVDEEARRLAVERQRVEQARSDVQNAALQMGTVTGTPPAANAAHEQSPEEAQRIAFEAERKKREYTSLFSSNVSLSFRKDQNAPPVGEHSGTAESLNALLSAVRQAPAATTPAAAQAPVEAPRAPEDPVLKQADGPQYRLFEGTVLEAVLTNRLNGSFSGPVNVMLTINVYSHDHQHLLIPQGSRVLGEIQRVNSFGQQRLAVFFHRLIMPDGYAISLDKFQGLNQIGETGLRDKVNHHYMQIFGVSLAIGAIAGVEQAGANYGYSMGGVDAYRRGVSESLSQSALRVLDRYLNILPTFVIREGARVKVYLTDDLMLPAYDRHRMPSNL